MRDGAKNIKIPQIGIVQIDDEVEIGANNCVDRAALGTTWIKRGVKTDNLVQIGHNVVVGEDTIIVAQAAIAGSAHIGKEVVLGGQVAISDHVHINDRAMVGSQSGVPKDVKSGEVVSGSPAILTVCGFEPAVFFPASPVSLNAFGLSKEEWKAWKIRSHPKQRSKVMDLPLYYQDIIRILPHRYPFLFVDRIIELELNKRVVGIKNVTIKKIKPITTTTGRNIVAQRVQEALGKDAVGTITPHSFRHYFATTVLACSGNLKLAQELARHKNIAVTQRYAHLSDDELDKGYWDVFEKDNDIKKEALKNEPVNCKH